MRTKRPRTPDPGDPDTFDDEIAAECEAFLAGRWAGERRAAGLPVPVWAWVNEAAHADLPTLRITACTEADGVEERTRATLARAVVAAAERRDLSTVQRDVLVPIELRLTGRVLTPRRLVEVVVAELF